MHSPRFADQPPAEIYAALLSEGIYIGSLRTLYRLLASEGESHERRAQRRPTTYVKPSLTASAPNQVWTWDITKLAGPTRGVFYYLYVVLDLFSRFVVGWMLAERENTPLATQFISDAIARHDVNPKALTLHNDRGAPMTSDGMAQLLARLGVTPSFSRPRVSDDNPFSESQFKTLKYQPDFPGRFESPEHARGWAREFFTWYNEEHHHTGLALFAPADVFHRRVADVAARRQAALDQAYAAHPERFRRRPVVPLPPERVHINPLTGPSPVNDVAASKDPPAASIPSREPPPEASLRPSPAPCGRERAQGGSRAAKPASEASEPLKRPSPLACCPARRADANGQQGGAAAAVPAPMAHNS
jgi:putative transposase